MDASCTSPARRIVRAVCLGAITILPVCLGAVFLHLYRHSPKLFAELCAEDHLVENMQFAGFLAAGILSSWLAVQFWKKTDRLNALAYGLFGLFCIFIAMEEISWGQRIFQFGTPDSVKTENVQDEFNLHNLKTIQAMLFVFYVLVGAYACVSAALWTIPPLRRQRWFRYLSVCPCLILYFLPVLVYGIYRLQLGSWSEMRAHFRHNQARMISLVQEPVELGLAAGFLLLVLFSWLRLRRERNTHRQEKGSAA